MKEEKVEEIVEENKIEESDTQNTEKVMQDAKIAVKRAWKGKVTFAVIFIACILLGYYKPMEPDQDFVNNVAYYIVILGMLAPLILYIIVNEMDKFLKRKAGVDITKNHKDSVLVKDENKPKKQKPLNPVLVSVLGTYYNMTQGGPKESEKKVEIPEENQAEPDSI